MTPKQDEIEALARVMCPRQEREWQDKLVPDSPLQPRIPEEERPPQPRWMRYAGLAQTVLAAGYSRTVDTLERAAKVADVAAAALEQAEGGHYVTSGDPGTLCAIDQARDIAAAIRAGKET